MSNISQASKDLKKKLSFNDYNSPAQQSAVKPVDQSASEPANNPNDKNIPTCQPAGMPSNQNAITSQTVESHDGISDIPARHHAGKSDHKKHDQRIPTQKIKATYYLSEDDNQALTDIYIKRLQNKNKTDKSALIAEAIRLLYKREMK